MNILESKFLENEQDEIDATVEDSLDFSQLANPVNWQTPSDYYRSMPASTRRSVDKVVKSDKKIREELRNVFLPELLKQGTLKRWGTADQNYIEALQQKKLYAGHVYATDGTVARYETLSLVGAQIAVSRLNYQGSTGQIAFNIMYMGTEVPRRMTAADIANAIRSRGKKLKARMPNVFLYTLMLYKERQLLMDTPQNAFKLMHGPIFPYEMLVGSGRQQTMKVCLDLLEDIIDDGNYAAIVSNDTHRELLALGMALNAGEYLVVNTGVELLDTFLDGANYTNTPIEQYGGKSQIELFNSFKVRYGSKVIQGVLKAHRMSKPYIFYCNANKLEEAVHMLLADAANTGARGFPLLIDMADQYCTGAFKASEYTNHMNAEFVRASGGSGMYQSERTTRD